LKTIGLIGGMSWESTAVYYRIINEEMQRRLGGLHSAKCLLYSVNFSEIEHMQATGEWEKAGELLGEAAHALEKAGADFIVICTNTMHKVFNKIQEKVTLPILHIVDATATKIKSGGIRKVGLLGTKYTMEQEFYIERLRSNNLEVIVPEAEEREVINTIIFEELCLGKIQPSSKEYYKQVIQRLAEAGAEGIILGCTEIGLLIKPEDVGLPLFDTSEIHAIEAVNTALK
jgi:aspartate racemase